MQTSLRECLSIIQTTVQPRLWIIEDLFNDGTYANICVSVHNHTILATERHCTLELLLYLKLHTDEFSHTMRTFNNVKILSLELPNRKGHVSFFVFVFLGFFRGGGRSKQHDSFRFR